jgi:hypothetical protein
LISGELLLDILYLSSGSCPVSDYALYRFQTEVAADVAVDLRCKVPLWTLNPVSMALDLVSNPLQTAWGKGGKLGFCKATIEAGGIVGNLQNPKGQKNVHLGSTAGMAEDKKAKEDAIRSRFPGHQVD